MIQLSLKGVVDIASNTIFHLILGIHSEEKDIKSRLSRDTPGSHEDGVTTDDNPFQTELHIPDQLILYQAYGGVHMAGHAYGADVLYAACRISSFVGEPDRRTILIAALIAQILPPSLHLVCRQHLQHHISGGLDPPASAE